MLRRRGWCRSLSIDRADLSGALQHHRKRFQSCCDYGVSSRDFVDLQRGGSFGADQLASNHHHHHQPLARRRLHRTSLHRCHPLSNGRRHRCCWSRQGSHARHVRRRQQGHARAQLRPRFRHRDVYHRTFGFHGAHARSGEIEDVSCTRRSRCFPAALLPYLFLLFTLQHLPRARRDRHGALHRPHCQRWMDWSR